MEVYNLGGSGLVRSAGGVVILQSRTNVECILWVLILSNMQWSFLKDYTKRFWIFFKFKIVT